MERKWSTREYQPGDEAGIIALWKEAFPEGESERADLVYWNWQFRDNPAGFGKIRVAVDNGTIVGQYAVIPMHMQVKGEPVLAALSLDTMTHPNYRRQGMFTTLANELYHELGRDGVFITYGFPNENSIGGFTRKLQWTHVCSLAVYVKPLRSRAIVDRIISNHLLATVANPFASLVTAVASRTVAVPSRVRANICWLEQFDTRADGLWRTAYDRRKIAVTRNAAFLNWRYLLMPQRSYRAVAFEEKDQLVAYAVVRCMEQFGLRGGMIADLIGQPGRDDALQAVLAAAIEYLASEEVDLVACLIHGDRRVIRLLKRNGFLLAPKRVFKEWYFGVRVNNDSVMPDLVNNPDSWYVTFGDTDVI